MNAELQRQLNRPSVYFVYRSKGEMDSGSSYRHSAMCEEDFDSEVLGVYLSLRHANRRAREAAAELKLESDDDSDIHGDSDVEELYEWSNEETGGEHGHVFDQVYISQYAIDDASPAFHA